MLATPGSMRGGFACGLAATAMGIAGAGSDRAAGRVGCGTAPARTPCRSGDGMGGGEGAGVRCWT
jgi:hypothetical protein